MSLLIKNIKSLIGTHPCSTSRLRGNEMAVLPTVQNAFLLVEKQRIVQFGAMPNCPDRADKIIDATDRLVLPAWCGLKAASDVEIKASFLGAHAVPSEYKENRNAYISLIINEMLPRIADEQLADYVDVFCEKIAFSSDETDLILTSAAKYGLKPKIHTNQFNSMGGIETAIKHKAVSVDHLEVLNDAELNLLKNSDTIAALLPTAPFFLNDLHTPPARKLMDAGVTVALATDFNPGTTPSVSMPFVLSLACIRLRMTPAEAINAATLNGAAALEMSDDFGSFAVGKMGNFIITKPVPSVAYLPYSFGSNWIETVVLKGNIQ